MKDDELTPWLERARSGDAEALAKLCQAVYPRVLRYMRYRVTADMAEDLTSEVFVRVLRNLRQQSGSFHAWLYRIAERVVIDHRREQSASKRTVMTEMTEQHEQQAQQQDDVGQAVANRMDLEQAIDRLSDDQRQLVTLKFIEGLGNEDVAEIMERKPGAIRVLQYRALARLRDLLFPAEVSHGS